MFLLADNKFRIDAPMQAHNIIMINKNQVESQQTFFYHTISFLILKLLFAL